MLTRYRDLLFTGVILIMAPACHADERDLATGLLADLVALNTAPSGGNDLRPAVTMLAELLRAEGFPEADIAIVAPTEKQPNLVVRYRSAAPRRKPILMMAHLDVVEALPSDWTVPPFEMTESDGYYYGRGTTDNKAGAAMLVANLIRMKREGFAPDRDLIVMLTADEEFEGIGALTLANEHRDLVDAEFALNTDGGYVMLVDDEPRAFIMQTSEKVYVTYRLEATDPGGHSSVPRSDNAISRVARTLAELDQHRFPIDLNETTRAFFQRWRQFASANDAALIEALLAGVPDGEITKQLDAQPYYNALARTTCIATQIEGGHAENAIPQKVTAVINCRVLPQFPTTSARDAIASMAAKNDVAVVQTYPDRPSPPSPLLPEVLEPVNAIAQKFWPGVVVIPEMSTGATDGLFIRNVGIPVYAVSAIAEDPADSRAHGQDERISVKAFEDATEYWYLLVKALAQP